MSRKGRRLTEGSIGSVSKPAAHAMPILLFSWGSETLLLTLHHRLWGVHALTLPYGLSVGPSNRKWDEPKPRTETTSCLSTRQHEQGCSSENSALSLTLWE